MENFSAYTILFAFCGLLLLSYLFSVLTRLTRIPSVLMLMGTGVALRYCSDWWHWNLSFPPALMEVLGTVGLIMIVLEAGLDLEVTEKKLPLIRSAFFSALVIFLFSACTVGAILWWWIPGADPLNCFVYALPLSIGSSAIVMPSVGHLAKDKQDFLIYEVAFSDVLGIMIFNFFTAGQVLSLQSVSWFFASIIIAVLLSVAVCAVLMILLVKNRIHIKFFLAFAILIVIYAGGKIFHLPSLISILMFGMVVNNWELIRWEPLKAHFSDEKVNEVAAFLKSITAETSFLIRTLFFVVFGFGIQLSFLRDIQILELGALIVAAMFVLRAVYLRILHRYNLFPEIFYLPRGLVTVLLFYKIPEWQKMEAFNEGVLFFVILATSVVMMCGSMMYRHKPELLEEAQP
jgi:hypothetical protein